MDKRCTNVVAVWTNLSTMGVYESFHVHTHSTRTLIQDGKLGLVVKQSSHLEIRQEIANTPYRDKTGDSKHTILYASRLASCN